MCVERNFREKYVEKSTSTCSNKTFFCVQLTIVFSTKFIFAVFQAYGRKIFKYSESLV